MNKNKYVAVLESFNLNYSRGSDILIFNSFGYMIGTLITGFIIKIFGKNKLVSLSSFLMIIGIICITSLNNFILIRLSLLLFGIGLGFIQVAGNSILLSVYSMRVQNSTNTCKV